jgi:hypothetical protein
MGVVFNFVAWLWLNIEETASCEISFLDAVEDGGTGATKPAGCVFAEQILYRKAFHECKHVVINHSNTRNLK